MAYEDVVCVRVRCDRCLVPGVTTTGQIRHWDQVGSALVELGSLGWEVNGQVQICSRCVAARECEQGGHDWDDWRPVGPVDPELSIRLCGRCGRDEVAVSTGVGVVAAGQVGW